MDLWQSRKAKYNSRYGVMIAKQWYWYQTWVDEVEKYCKEKRDWLS